MAKRAQNGSADKLVDVCTQQRQQCVHSRDNSVDEDSRHQATLEAMRAPAPEPTTPARDNNKISSAAAWQPMRGGSNSASADITDIAGSAAKFLTPNGRNTPKATNISAPWATAYEEETALRPGGICCDVRVQGKLRDSVQCQKPGCRGGDQ